MRPSERNHNVQGTAAPHSDRIHRRTVAAVPDHPIPHQVTSKPVSPYGDSGFCLVAEFAWGMMRPLEKGMPVFKIARTVQPPKGPSTEMELVYDQKGLIITATGPNGTQAMQLSMEEAETLFDLMTYARPSYKKTTE